jgi:signal transduction histidine kinase
MVFLLILAIVAFSSSFAKLAQLKNGVNHYLTGNYYKTTSFRSDVYSFLNAFENVHFSEGTVDKNTLEELKKQERDFLYEIEDLYGNVYTNVEQSIYEEFQENSFYINFTSQADYYSKSIPQLMNNHNLTGLIAVNKGNSFNSILLKAQEYHKQVVKFYTEGIISLLLLIGSSYVLYKNRETFKGPIQSLKDKYERWPIDIRWVLLFINGSIVLRGVYYNNLIDLLFYSGFMAFFGLQILSFIQGLKDSSKLKEEWKASLILKATNSVLYNKISKNVVIKVIVSYLLVYLLGVGIFIGTMDVGVFLLYAMFCFGVGIFILAYVGRKLHKFKEIIRTTQLAVEGHVVAPIKVKGRGLFADLAHNINQMAAGVEVSKKAQLKSERLKTELISNVSHDLRTPLTSIITYTELLKDETISEDERISYIEILDKKSKRLKILIDDLFEASKMISGNIELSLENVDMVQLINQAMGEYEEKIKESSLDFIIKTNQPQIYATVDGSKMWRVFDNVIGNIIKYSLEGTRVYITAEALEHQVYIAFKNISKYELSENIEELIHRFKRGDESRHTDGSGLGLAIAKSIVDHHGGEFTISMDGDLFKVEIWLN